MPDTLRPIAGRYEFCDCGHLASFDLIVAVGWPRPKPVSEPVCARCASLEAGRPIAELLALLAGCRSPGAAS